MANEARKNLKELMALGTVLDDQFRQTVNALPVWRRVWAAVRMMAGRY